MAGLDALISENWPDQIEEARYVVPEPAWSRDCAGRSDGTSRDLFGTHLAHTVSTGVNGLGSENAFQATRLSDFGAKPVEGAMQRDRCDATPVCSVGQELGEGETSDLATITTLARHGAYMQPA